MPIRTDHDELILSAAREKNSLNPLEIAAIVRSTGKSFYSSDYCYGWQTARRLVKKGQMVQIGPGKFALARPSSDFIGIPELGNLSIDTLKRVKACFLLAAHEMDTARGKADGTLSKWLDGASEKCRKDAEFLDIMIGS